MSHGINKAAFGVSRRRFLKTTAAAAAGAAMMPPLAVSADNNRWTALESYLDDVTGARLYVLAGGGSRNDKIYQTHPQWVQGMDYFVFHSDRSGGWRPHILELASGKIVPLTDRDVGAITIARDADTHYFLADGGVWAGPLADAFGDGRVPLRIADLPEKFASNVGGISLDASGLYLYAGAALVDSDTYGLFGFHVANRTWNLICEVDFKIGHVIANPDVPGRVMFCHETGGDAPQRMWVIETKGKEPAPFYEETYDEWVTHETWWGPDRAVFTIWPYDDAHKQAPHGIFTVDVRDRIGHQVCQYPAWHTDGSPDGKWVMGDDFDRNIWLVHPESGERRLLTQGHKGANFNTHPHASFTPDSQGIVLNSSRSGNEDIVLVELQDFASLPKAYESGV